MKSYTRLAEIPVVLISGQDPQVDLVAHGTVSAFLKKPYDTKRLLELVSLYCKAPGP